MRERDVVQILAVLDESYRTSGVFTRAVGITERPFADTRETFGIRGPGVSAAANRLKVGS